MKCISFKGSDEKGNTIRHNIMLEHIFDLVLDDGSLQVIYISTSGARITQSFQDEEKYAEWKEMYAKMFGLVAEAKPVEDVAEAIEESLKK